MELLSTTNHSTLETNILNKFQWKEPYNLKTPSIITNKRKKIHSQPSCTFQSIKSTYQNNDNSNSDNDECFITFNINLQEADMKFRSFALKTVKSLFKTYGLSLNAHDILGTFSRTIGM